MSILVKIFCIIAFVFCFGWDDSSSGHKFYVLPIALLLFSVMESAVLSTMRKSYVYFIFYFQALIRYCVVPMGMATGVTLLAHGSSSSINIAIYVMCVELVLIFFVFIYQNYKISHLKEPTKIILANGNYPIYFFIALFFLIVATSGFLGKVNFIWNLNDYVQHAVVEGEEIESSSIGALLFIPLKVMLLLVTASWILKSNRIKNKPIYLILIMAVSSLFIVGTSRLSILTFILPFYLLLNSIVGKKARTLINIGLASVVLPVILITSVAKFSRSENVATTEAVVNVNSLNAYFAGPGNIAVGIDAFEDQERKEYGLFFLNDLFQNVPIASKFTVSEYKSNMVFNKEIYGHALWQTQIVPLSIAGLFHFDVFGFGIYCSIFLALAFYFEKKARMESYLPYKYVFFSITLTLSLVFMLNIGSMVVTVIRSLVFVYLPFYIVRNIK